MYVNFNFRRSSVDFYGWLVFYNTTKSLFTFNEKACRAGSTSIAVFLINYWQTVANSPAFSWRVLGAFCRLIISTRGWIKSDAYGCISAPKTMTPKINWSKISQIHVHTHNTGPAVFTRLSAGDIRSVAHDLGAGGGWGPCHVVIREKKTDFAELCVSFQLPSTASGM